MRVLLVSANREHLPDPIFPLGLAYIAAAATNAGHEINVADLCFGRIELQTNNPEKAIDFVNHCPFMLNAFRLGGNTNISILLVGLSFRDLDQIVNRHFRDDPDVVNVRIDVIADVINDFVLPIDLNLEFGELDLDSCCCGKCSC